MRHSSSARERSTGSESSRSRRRRSDPSRSRVPRVRGAAAADAGLGRGTRPVGDAAGQPSRAGRVRICRRCGSVARSAAGDPRGAPRRHDRGAGGPSDCDLSEPTSGSLGARPRVRDPAGCGAARICAPVHARHGLSISPVALTFDDGPSEWTAPILDLLAEHRAHATFFLIGSLIGGRPEIVERMQAEGHEIANHTWSASFADTRLRRRPGARRTRADERGAGRGGRKSSDALSRAALRGRRSRRSCCRGDRPQAHAR